MLRSFAIVRRKYRLHLKENAKSTNLFRQFSWSRWKINDMLSFLVFWHFCKITGRTSALVNIQTVNGRNIVVGDFLESIHVTYRPLLRLAKAGIAKQPRAARVIKSRYSTLYDCIGKVCGGVTLSSRDFQGKSCVPVYFAHVNFINDSSGAETADLQNVGPNNAKFGF